MITQSEDLAEYFIFQYMPDPFRREPKNVGVAVHFRGEVQARFFARTAQSTDDKPAIDRRRTGRIKDPSTYAQWVKYWTKAIKQQNWKARLLESSKMQYTVIPGGQVGGVQDSGIEQVLEYLYNMLVEDNGFDVLVEDERASSSIELRQEIQAVFTKEGLTASKKHSGRGQIYTDRDVFGTTGPFRFHFVQVNGAERPMEVFDFRRSPQRHLEYHIGWARTTWASGCSRPFRSRFSCEGMSQRLHFAAIRPRKIARRLIVRQQTCNARIPSYRGWPTICQMFRSAVGYPPMRFVRFSARMLDFEIVKSKTNNATLRVYSPAKTVAD